MKRRREDAKKRSLSGREQDSYGKTGESHRARTLHQISVLTILGWIGTLGQPFLLKGRLTEWQTVFHTIHHVQKVISPALQRRDERMMVRRHY